MKTLAAALALVLALPGTASLAQSAHHGGGHYSGGHNSSGHDGGGNYGHGWDGHGYYGHGYYGHGYHGHGYYGPGYVGGWYGGYYFDPFLPFYYPYYWYPRSDDYDDSDYPHVYGPPPSEQPAPEAGHDWFFCKESKGYYPYVKTCPNGWQRVPAEPPEGSGGQELGTPSQ